jgi:predicted phage-related endonuclease
MPDVKWVGQHVEAESPRRPKKLTGTRFAAVLGLNPWETPFKTWCAITRTYEEPFTDTIYTAAGKVIEPKQAEYMRQSYLMNLTSPTDVWGEDYFKKTRGDFFPDQKILGGMWDYLEKDKNGKPIAVLEMKTTKRAEDWMDDIPEYYAMQAALYAYLLGVDQVYMVCSLLNQGDYDHPDEFVPSVSNTFVRPFKVSERYPRMDGLVKIAKDWWDTHVVSGISPDYDERRDADILKALRTAELPRPTEDIKKTISDAEAIQRKLDALKEKAKPLEKELKNLTDDIKYYLQNGLSEGDKYAVYDSKDYEWKLVKNESLKLDEKKLKEDGIYDKYTVPAVSYRLTVAKHKED